ncbi:MAG: hypothetical protein AB8H80_21615 [Planctomycetota bacterium]
MMIAHFVSALAFCVLMSGGANTTAAAASTTVLEDGDAVCTLKMRYEGSLQDGPTWTNEDGKCVGACRTSGKCKLTDTGDGSTAGTTIVTIIECRCPSGGGNGGCRAQEVRTSTNGGQSITSRKMQCVGSSSCKDSETCDWKDTTPPPGFQGTFAATCKCQ